MIWKSTPKSSSDIREWNEEPVADHYTKAVEDLTSGRTFSPSPPSYEDLYETSSTTRMVELEEFKRKVIILEEKIALLEKKMKHMEETFAKTVQDLVESLAKEYDERTTDKATLDDIPF